MIYPASLPQSLAVMTDVMIFSSYVDLLLVVHYSNNYVVITIVKHYEWLSIVYYSNVYVIITMVNHMFDYPLYTA